MSAAHDEKDLQGARGRPPRNEDELNASSVHSQVMLAGHSSREGDRFASRAQSAAERAYEEIKAHAMEGRLKRGRIDLQRLADRLRMSQTPVREALARLSAERIVAAMPGQGYMALIPSARQLRQLYIWSGELAGLALADARVCAPPAQTAAPEAGQPLCGPYAGRWAQLLSAIASAHESGELSLHTRQTAERLYQARAIEPLLFADAEGELSQFCAAWREDRRDWLRAALAAHHRARANEATRLSEALEDRCEHGLQTWP